MTQVKLLGELGEKFGTDWQCAGNSMRDIIKLIDCQKEGFREYLIDCHNKNIGFTLQNGEDFIEEELEMFLPTLKNTVIISPIPAGSGKGLGKILAAIVFITAIVLTGGAAAGAAGTQVVGQAAAAQATAVSAGASISSQVGAGLAMQTASSSISFLGMNIGTATATGNIAGVVSSAVHLNHLGYFLVSLGANLGLMGIAQMQAPDAGDMTSDPSYLFNGADSNLEQGQPVPVLYGRMRVGGTPLSQGFATGQLRGGKLNFSNTTTYATHYGTGTYGTIVGGGSSGKRNGQGAVARK